MKKYNNINDCTELIGKTLYEILPSEKHINHKVFKVDFEKGILKTEDEFGSTCTVYPSDIGTILFVK